VRVRGVITRRSGRARRGQSIGSDGMFIVGIEALFVARIGRGAVERALIIGRWWELVLKRMGAVGLLCPSAVGRARLAVVVTGGGSRGLMRDEVISPSSQS
jgi:hypothetical protein